MVRLPLTTRPSGVRDSTSEEEIASILRGEPVRPTNPSSFAYMAVRHGVAPLLVKAGVAALLPPEEGARLRAESRRHAAITELGERDLRLVLEALHSDGPDVLLVKGAHLANSCYPESYLRPRDDTDLLVRPADRDRVAATLARLGYRRQPVQTAPDVLGQMMFDREEAIGGTLDVHWRAVRPHAAASLFEFDDLASRAVALPRLGEHARGPGPVDALALACVHQAAHHPDHDLLLWTYDVHLLLQGFTQAEADDFVRLAIDRRIATLSVAAIEPAASAFRHPAASDVLERLRPAARDEPTAALLQRRRRIDDIRLDLRAVRGTRARTRLLAAHIFPPAAYMRAAYAPGSRAPLPWLYLKRLVRGLRRE
jgi:hypothetical protein